jgi:hypothetical protein
MMFPVLAPDRLGELAFPAAALAAPTAAAPIRMSLRFMPVRPFSREIGP